MRFISSRSGLAMVAILLSLFVYACGDSDSTNDGNGNGNSDYTLYGQTCFTQADCGDNMSCIAIDGQLVCTVLCSADAECEAIRPGDSCQEKSGQWVCTPSNIDGDGSDGDGIDGDGNTDCEPGEIACKDSNTLEKCSSDGKSWQFYKGCPEGQTCFEGNCVSSDGDNTYFCEPDTYRCHGARDVERCSSEGNDWTLYRTCDPGEICLDGACQSLTDGDSDGSGEDGDEDIPLGDPCEDNDDCFEDNHYCLIDDFVQETGYCQPFCNITGVHCPAGFYCGEGTCHPIAGYCVSDGQCGMYEFCDIRPGASDGMCNPYCNVPGQQCPNHTECDADPQSLNYGKCAYVDDVDYCSTDGECQYGQWCYIPIGQTEGFCQDVCKSDDDCAGSLVCKDGKCQTGVPVPDCGPAGCAQGYVCDPMYNACVLNCPPCDEGWSCNAQSAPNCIEGCDPPAAGVCGFGLPGCCPPQSCSVFIWAYGLIGVCA